MDVARLKLAGREITNGLPHAGGEPVAVQFDPVKFQDTLDAFVSLVDGPVTEPPRPPPQAAARTTEPMETAIREPFTEADYID
jgi:hypothetical protein